MQKQQHEGGWSFSEWLKEKVKSGFCFGGIVYLNTDCQQTTLKPR